MTIGQKLMKTSRRALEDLAEAEFSVEKIVAACGEAALKGYMRCEIKPTIPVDLSSTEAMKTAISDLKKQWLELEWLPRGLPGEPPYKVLEVRWDPRKTIK